ncbi:hypothetical protein [Ruegeria arenilitoris]|uniref:hypothetical protein n=1 Tax=Ruegeria arenilitoris TaxID=1173585 RepID=UPI00147AB795|nr:hypothetical protein [Ruegeria arenilitoris]
MIHYLAVGAGVVMGYLLCAVNIFVHWSLSSETNEQHESQMPREHGTATVHAYASVAVVLAVFGAAFLADNFTGISGPIATNGGWPLATFFLAAAIGCILSVALLTVDVFDPDLEGKRDKRRGLFAAKQAIVLTIIFVMLSFVTRLVTWNEPAENTLPVIEDTK